MKPARYIFINRGLGMSHGKIAAQAAHAETLAMHDYMQWNCVAKSTKGLSDQERAWVANQVALFSLWFGDGHYAKYVMKANDSDQLATIREYIETRGFKTYTVIDEGHTEDTWMVRTAMAVELVDKDDRRTAEVFGNFRMFKPVVPKPAEPTPPRQLIPWRNIGVLRWRNKK